MQKATLCEANDTISMESGRPASLGRDNYIRGLKTAFQYEPAWRLRLIEESVEVPHSEDMAVYRSTYWQDASTLRQIARCFSRKGQQHLRPAMQLLGENRLGIYLDRPAGRVRLCSQRNPLPRRSIAVLPTAEYLRQNGLADIFQLVEELLRSLCHAAPRFGEVEGLGFGVWIVRTLCRSHKLRSPAPAIIEFVTKIVDINRGH